jgi:methyl-accepting chemotaxis protein
MVQISSTMQQLVTSFRDMTDRSHDMVRTSKDAAEECHKGHALLMDSQHGMEQIKREVGRITEHMRTLVEKSQQINGVLEMINELASQTNLLSINATIEAAGAGESGRRFAVVAEEIRLLAERAVEFTEEIRALIEDIQDTAHVTSAATAEGAQSVDRGLGKTSKIADNFDTLITLVTRTADAVQAIETTTREQVYSVEQVTEAVESLSQIATESEDQAGATLDAVEHLREVARDLQQIAGRKPGQVDGGE